MMKNMPLFHLCSFCRNEVPYRLHACIDYFLNVLFYHSTALPLKLCIKNVLSVKFMLYVDDVNEKF